MSNKFTIEEMRNIANLRGGTCLSRRFVLENKCLSWQCGKGHAWKASPSNIKGGTWCPYCAGNAHLNIDDMQKLALSSGGNCLSKKYLGINEKLEWQCASGHTWWSTPANVKAGSWCLQCAGRIRITISDVKEVAAERGGYSLSDVYVNYNSKLRWKCDKGHIWEANYNNIKSGKWCPYCAGNVRLSLNHFNTIAEKKGGKCLSTNYENIKSELTFECTKGHQWTTKAENIRNGRWCPYCAHKVDTRTIDDMVEIAKSRGGECISKQYFGSHKGLLWKCELGHMWSAVPYSIIGGTWCPKCTGYLNENLCRVILEKYFNTEFKKTKPGWLITTNGNKLELDGYCENLKLAFEYQGRQHYKNIGYFNKKRSLSKIEQFDEEKARLCLDHGVLLMIIPYTIKTLDLQAFILKKINEIGLKDRIVNFEINITPREIYSSILLRRLEKIALENEGKCLSNMYIGDTTQMWFECKYGHRWKAIPRDIIRGSWCHICWRSKPAKYTFEDIHKIVESKGGICSCEKYVNLKSIISLKCGEGHKWNAKAVDILEGHWCRACSYTVVSKKLTKHNIDELRNIATSKGGKCLSDKYGGINSKLSWECGEGHQWETTPEHIIGGSWCPICKGKTISIKKIKYNVEDMQNIAKSRGGKFLSTEYLGISRRHLWECEQGHKWQAKPSNIKSGTWCPIYQRIAQSKKQIKFTVDDMNKLARTRGGKFLSNEFLGTHKKHVWECRYGHRWLAIPINIKRGRWCPVCAGKETLNVLVSAE